MTRDAVLFSAGLAGVFYETVFDHTERTTLLLLFGAMMGLPAFLRTDEQAKPPAKPSTKKHARDDHRTDDHHPIDSSSEQ